MKSSIYSVCNNSQASIIIFLGVSPNNFLQYTLATFGEWGPLMILPVEGSYLLFLCPGQVP